jgi:hypothetical protein
MNGAPNPDPLDAAALAEEWVDYFPNEWLPPVEKPVDNLLKWVGRALVVIALVSVFLFFFYLVVINAPAAR